MKLYDDLVWRGLIKDVAGDNLEEVLNGEPITFYWGTDPTADSLHIGHYSSLVTAKRLANMATIQYYYVVAQQEELVIQDRPQKEKYYLMKQ